MAPAPRGYPERAGIDRWGILPMATRTICLTAGLISYLFAARMARADDPPRDPERVYAVTCRYCHDNGIGQVLRGAKLPPERIQLAVRQGYVAMPAFAPSFITDAELADLVKLLTAAAPPAPEPQP